MFARASRQQKQIDTLQAQVRSLEGLVDQLARRAGVDEAELLELRGAAGDRIPQRCRDLVAEGKIIEAIKVHRVLTGSGLKDAKDAIDAYRARAC